MQRTRAQSILIAVIVASVGLIVPAKAQLPDYNTTDSLCAAFVGRPSGNARGQTVMITCDIVRQTVIEIGRQTTHDPFQELVTFVRRHASARFEDMLADDNDLRNACSREYLIFFQTAYSCTIGTPSRFVLNLSGTIQRVEVSMPTSSPAMQAQFSKAAARTGVDKFSDDAIALTMQAYAMRLRQLAGENEIYRSDGHVLYLTILNPSGS